MNNFDLSQAEVAEVKVDRLFLENLFTSEHPREYIAKNGPKKPSDRAKMVYEVLSVTLEKANTWSPKEILRAIEIAEAIIQSYGPRERAKRDKLLNNLELLKVCDSAENLRGIVESRIQPSSSKNIGIEALKLLSERIKYFIDNVRGEDTSDDDNPLDEAQFGTYTI